MGGLCLPLGLKGGVYPWADTPSWQTPPTPWADTPHLLGGHPHPRRRPLPWTVRILLESILVERYNILTLTRNGLITFCGLVTILIQWFRFLDRNHEEQISVFVVYENVILCISDMLPEIMARTTSNKQTSCYIAVHNSQKEDNLKCSIELPFIVLYWNVRWVGSKLPWAIKGLCRGVAA